MLTLCQHTRIMPALCSMLNRAYYAQNYARLIGAAQAAVAGSVALFTHCQAVQLLAMTDFVVLNRRTKARIKNCKFFGPNEAK